MEIRINPASLMRGKVVLPASKSISNRALVIYALSQGKAHHDASLFDGLQHISDCDDTQVMWNALTRMPYQIDIKAAGTAMRFLTAYLCTQEGTHEITGTARMRQRPIGVLVDALRSLGAQIDYVENEGFSPTSCSCRPLASVGPIISRALTYWLLTPAGSSSLPPASSPPLMRRGGKPSFST